jgi:hypothetical protein
MALSNWDTLAVNHRGESMNGNFTAPNGIQVQFYKNWLYLRDEASWREGDPYIKNTVGEIRQGDMDYRGIEIRAKRGPQRGVYAVVTHGWGDDLTGMAGCAVLGYVDPPAPCQCNDGCRTYYCHEDGEEMMAHCGTCDIVVPDSIWVGVSPECNTFLMQFLEELHKETSKETSAFSKMAAGLIKAVRFNQGDAFFAAALGVEVPMTPPGEADPTFFQQMFAKEKE